MHYLRNNTERLKKRMKGEKIRKEKAELRTCDRKPTDKEVRKN
jgi:hypothetical protein